MTKITSDNYVSEVLRTEPVDMEAVQKRLCEPETVRLLHAVLGITTEAGEIVDVLKKHIFYGKPIDEVNLREELGDSMWYVGLAVDVLRTTMDEIMTTNIAKLRARYPEKFTEEAALNRNLDAEKTILEGNA